MRSAIRKASLRDARSIQRMDTVVPTDSRQAEWIDRWLRKDLVLVAENERRAVGYGVLNHEFSQPSQIVMLMISKEVRGKRIGGKLLSALEKCADTPKLFITTNLSNHPMPKLLSRNGYRPYGNIDELGPGDPELVFVKHLKQAKE